MSLKKALWATCHPDELNRSLGKCTACYNRDWYQKNRQHVIDTSMKYYWANVDRKREEARVKYRTNHRGRQEQNRANRLKNRFNITPEQYQMMLDKQNGVCAICQHPNVPNTKRLSVDHDHVTLKVRGLLCTSCNTSLGIIENTEWCNKAQLYLEETK